jgi:hypothetical protein
MRSKETGPAPRTITAIVSASARRWNSKPSFPAGIFPSQFIKNPTLEWTVTSATAMTQKIPKAATRARRPTNKPRLPRNLGWAANPAQTTGFFGVKKGARELRIFPNIHYCPSTAKD